MFERPACLCLRLILSLRYSSFSIILCLAAASTCLFTCAMCLRRVQYDSLDSAEIYSKPSRFSKGLNAGEFATNLPTSGRSSCLDSSSEVLQKVDSKKEGSIICFVKTVMGDSSLFWEVIESESEAVSGSVIESES